MANTNAPKGFSPVSTVSGASWNEQGRMYAIANDASNTYAIGDVVKIATGADANGVSYVTKLTDGGAGGDIPLGVIVGFVKPAAGISLVGTPLTQEQIYLPLSSGAQYVMVVDDPNIVMEAQFDSTAVALTDLHKNCAYTVTADQTSTLSQSSPMSSTVLTTPNTGATYPLQIIGLVQRPNTQGNAGAYSKVLVKWNYHQFGMSPTASGAAGA